MKNIILIMADQFRWDCMGCSGNGQIATPHLDELAADACFFSKGYSPCPVCVPARACMITGHKPSKTGFFNNDFTVPWNFRDTVVERLRNAGYQTINVGKNHFKPQRAHLGYEINLLYETEESEDHIPTEYHDWLSRTAPSYVQDTAMKMDHNSWVVWPWTAPIELHPTEWTAATAIEQIRRRDPERPFFIKISFHRPHPPIDPPGIYWQKYMNKALDPPAIGDWAPDFEENTADIAPFEGRISPECLMEAKRGYYAQIEHIDSQIGRIVRYLRKEKLYDDSLIIFTSDHGELLGDHNMFRKGPAFEGSAHIPFIVKFPEFYGLNGKQDVPVTLLDIAPTLLAIAGIDIPDNYDGLSLLDILSDHTIRTAIKGECYRKNKKITTGGMFVVDRRFKYVWNSWTGQEFLFDLESDPHELHDISKVLEYGEALRRLRCEVIREYASRPEDGMLDANGKLLSGKVLPHYRKP